MGALRVYYMLQALLCTCTTGCLLLVEQQAVHCCMTAALDALQASKAHTCPQQGPPGYLHHACTACHTTPFAGLLWTGGPTGSYHLAPKLAQAPSSARTTCTTHHHLQQGCRRLYRCLIEAMYGTQEAAGTQGPSGSVCRQWQGLDAQ